MDQNDIVKRVVAIIEQAIGANLISETTPLISSAMLDSLTIINLVCELENQLGITISEESVTEDNFETPAAIASLCSANLGTNQIGDSSPTSNEPEAMKLTSTGEYYIDEGMLLRIYPDGELPEWLRDEEEQEEPEWPSFEHDLASKAPDTMLGSIA